MDFDKALYSRRVVTAKGIKEAIIFIKNGKIIDVITSNEELIVLGYKTKSDGNNLDGFVPRHHHYGDLVIMSGLIDAHVHINEPGRADWEGFDTATRAAAAGGVTTLIEMPLNASPVTTTVAAFEQKLTATQGKLHVNCGFYGGLVPQNHEELPDLMRSGVFGIKCFLTHSGIDEFPNVTETDLQKAMPLIAATGLPLLVHAELDTAHPQQVFFQKNPTSYQAYLKSRPKSWENNAIKMMLRLCESTRCPTHIVHLSSADLIPTLKDAKKYLPLTIETTPQYLYFAAEDIPDAQTVFKCAPPIRERTNNDKLWAALRDGTLDFIASDHSPAPPPLKEIASGNLAKAWGGISGLQFTLPVVWTAGQERGFSIEDMARLLSENSAKFLKLRQKGRIEKGCDADLVIWNPEADCIIEEKDVHHRHKITPYLNEKLKGQVVQTYINGERVFDNGAFVSLQQGKVLLHSI